MAVTEVQKKPKRLRRERKREWWEVHPPLGLIIVETSVAAGIAGYVEHSGAWAFAWGFAICTVTLLVSVFDALNDLRWRLDDLRYGLFGGIDDDPERRLDFYMRWGHSGALYDLKSGQDTMMRSLEEICGEQRQ